VARAPENLGAVGIGVSDLARSEDFYTRVLGMSVQQRIDLPHLKEVVVGYEGRTSVVLMHWLDGSERNYKANAVKLVFFVPDPKAVIARIRADGLPIQREAEVMPEFHNMIIGLAEDPDGYVVELLESPRPAESAAAAAPALTALQRLEVEQACARLALDYSFLADGARMDEWSQLFADDGEMHLFGQVHKGPAAIRAAVGAGAQPGAVTAHAVTNHRIDVLGPDEAEGAAYVIVFAGQKKDGAPPAAPRISPMIVGVYHDRYRRTEKGWKFARRAFEPTFTTAPPE
jgi:lactoylglutathione lyase